MRRRILIDASHKEETRVVVLNNGRVEEFESQTSIKQQLKGNIYLAKVTRVEPSLQAAFVDYGGDRHGFLPFSEMHPDYYNLPVADKEELLASLRKMRSSSSDDSEDRDEKDFSDFNATDEEKEQRRLAQEESKSRAKDEESNDYHENFDDNLDHSDEPNIDVIDNDSDVDADIKGKLPDLNLYKRYKIQEVIKRNQIILVQVEKEERGNKGASLTTFISLAGRYCVLMPNSLRSGGVSRRIGSFEDRKRLKQIIKQLKIPEETGLIVRTAGSGKSHEQIRQDYNYLVNLWNHIRQETLESKAPAFIHVEGDIVKRTLRDWYDESIDELLIEGDDAYKDAHNFMKEVMPEQSAKIKHYKNRVPLYSRYRVEEQMALLFSQQVSLESGGSIVIMPTEALISIDVNSGKLTNTRNVEDTATNTNLEAAREIARQLRLRNLSGLIVIDFIDMMDLKNKKAVEKELKIAFATDRAKIQIGRISTFGLLEMSRQRLSPSFIEINTVVCPSCKGVGFVKDAGSIAVNLLRSLEHEIGRGKEQSKINVYLTSLVALYILNNKKAQLSDLENRHNIKIILNFDENLGLEGYRIVSSQPYNNRNNNVENSANSNDNVVDISDNNNKNQFKKRDKNKKNKKPKDFREQNRPEYDTDSDQVDNGADNAEPQNKPAKKAVVAKVGLFEGLWQKIID